MDSLPDDDKIFFTRPEGTGHNVENSTHGAFRLPGIQNLA